jgi:hypothetical protein
VPELYDQFANFSKVEVQHFRKLKQQRKVPKSDEAPRPRYNDNQCNYPKPVHNIDSDSCGPPENWQKSYEESSQERSPNTFKQRSPQYNQRGKALKHGRGQGLSLYTLRPLYYMYQGNKTNHHTKDCPIYINTKWKIHQESTQPSPQIPSREVNHTMQWAPHNQQHSPSYPPACIIQPKHTIIAKLNLRHITNHTIMPLPTILNLRQFHK